MRLDGAQGRRALRTRHLRPLLGLLWALLVLGYIVLVAVTTGAGHARPAAWMLMAMLSLGGLHALFEHKRPAVLLALFNLVLVALVFRFRGPVAALSLTTAIIQAMISFLFFRGLRRGASDIVSVIAFAIRAERSARERTYIRAVAWSWAVFMALMSLGSFIVAFAPTGAFWWWWMNIAPFALPVGFFLLEWLFRQFWLRKELRAAGPINWSRIRKIDFKRLFEP